MWRVSRAVPVLRGLPGVLRRSYAAPRPSESFLSGTSATYMEEMYNAWRTDPASVHKSWQTFFAGKNYSSPPGISSLAAAAATDAGTSTRDIMDALKVHELIRGYQVRGHNIANLDPLGIFHADLDGSIPPELTLEYYQFSKEDLSRTVMLNQNHSKLFGGRNTATIEEIHERCKAIYCGTIGYEYMHIQDREACNWLRDYIERPPQPIDPEKQKYILNELVKGEGFEKFLQKKFGTEKRFGVEGCEAMIPALNRMIEHAADRGAEMLVFGMPHRGRLNTLHNVVRKKVEVIFSEFHSTLAPDDEGSGDVKYHLGMSSDIVTSSGKKVHLSLLANPSHLEAVDPVVLGKTRAEQQYKKDPEGSKVIPVLIHGDAAFAGQGVVYESLGLSDLPAYSVGGTIHFIVNNQIGFTTDPRFSRSSDYCTDIAKVVSAPIFHVNGDDPEAVIRCVELAVEWRQTFHTDVVVDIVCYRRHGHNETDQPKFTQPRMYNAIEKHPSTLTIYAEKLIKDGVVSEQYIKDACDRYEAELSQGFEKAKTYEPTKRDFLDSYWKGFKRRVKNANIYNTGVDIDLLRTIGHSISTTPADLSVHPALKRILKARLQSFENNEVDWATAEALAFGSLLLEGNHVRLCGQDVERGTFSQRHHVIHDQESKERRTYVPLQHLSDKQGQYTVANSHLSEFAALGFELGYSQTNPYSLVCWEAQFGDFANTAQCIIDQFISSGEAKWNRQNGLVMLLPHGYEGMGPEHSSARLERFLQMCDDDEDVYPEMRHVARTQIERSNMQVVCLTTPSNIFHILRRQIHREFRKPLIVLEPKSLLRHPLAVSKLEHMGPGTRFLRFIPEQDTNIYEPGSEGNANVRRLVLCTGKVYYELLEERTRLGIRDVALARVEQLSPFPMDLVHRHADNFPNAEIVWCQEEPKNMGGWSYVKPRIETALRQTKHHAGRPPRYVGRKPSAATATGDKNAHKTEQHLLVDTALAN